MPSRRSELTAVALVLGLFLALTAPSVAAPAAALSEAPEEATSAALGWLGLVDDGKYAESWRQAGRLFRRAMPEADWVRSLEGVRRPLGAKSSRVVSTAVRRSSLPAAPDGDYVVFTLATSFAKKASAEETVTVIREDDGVWRVVGYYIR